MLRTEESARKEEEDECSFLRQFFGEAEEVLAAEEEKRRRREQQEEAYRDALRKKKEKRDELRKVFMAQPLSLSLFHNPIPWDTNSYRTRRGGLSHVVKERSAPSEEEDEECVDLEPLFYDEAEMLAEYAAGEEKRKQKEKEARQKEMLIRRWNAYYSVLDSIRDYDHRRKCHYYRRLNHVDLSIFDLNEESPLGPMRHTGDQSFLHLDGSVLCKQGGQERFLLVHSVNVLSVKIASSKVGFPINVYGTVIARDSLDKKCVYLFRRDRNHCQLIKSEDDLLILTGPKRGLALKSDVYFEVDLKIKGDQGQKDRQFSNGFLTLDALPRFSWNKMKVETNSLDTKLGVLEVTFVVVPHAVEATISIEVVKGEFDGKITACTTTIRNRLVLHDSKETGVITCDGKRLVQMLQPVVAVFAEEELEVTAVAQTGAGEVERSVTFTPRASGVQEDEITCGSVMMVVKVYWSIIECSRLGILQ